MLFLAAFAASPSLALAQAKTRIKFEAGNDNAGVDGVVKGHEYRDYLLGARAGQKMSVALTTSGNAFFNILPPGSNDVAIYNSSLDGNTAVDVVLPADGDYTIRVYLMDNDKDAGKSVSYTVSTTIMGG
jgi:hypothetical protein